MARNLETLKEKLWDQFDRAAERLPDAESYGIYHGAYAAAQARTSMSNIALSIVAIETELRAREEAAKRIPSPIDKPTR